MSDLLPISEANMSFNLPDEPDLSRFCDCGLGLVLRGGLGLVKVGGGDSSADERAEVVVVEETEAIEVSSDSLASSSSLMTSKYLEMVS